MSFWFVVPGVVGEELGKVGTASTGRGVPLIRLEPTHPARAAATTTTLSIRENTFIEPNEREDGILGIK
jgi:hypothetical protein